MTSRCLLTPSIKWSSLVLLLLVICLPAAGFAQQQVYEVDVQAVHPNGTLLKVSKVIYEPTHTAVQVQVVNGHRFTVYLNSREDTVLRDAMGTRYRLSPPQTRDPRLPVPAGEALEGTLIFLGGIPADSTEVTLIVNENGDKESDSTLDPSFDIKLPLRAEETEQKKNRPTD